MSEFHDGDRVLHTRREETGSVVEDEALPKCDGQVWLLLDGHPAPIPVSGHLLTRLAEQRVAVSAYDWSLLMDLVRPKNALERLLVEQIVANAQRIE